jgi:multiple sugar transport system substrate-binding protein
VVPATTSSPASAQEDTIRFWTFEYADPVDPFFVEYVEEWNATHDIKVERQEFPWAQYTGEILTTGIATGEAPDVFFISPGDWRRYAESGLALPLEDYMPQYLLDDLLPAAVDAVTLDGHIYSVPFEMEPVALWYNKEILAEAGLEVPTSWDELVAAAETLTTSDRYGILLPMNPDYFENFIFYPFLWMAGGQVVNEDFTEAAVNTPEAARALDLWGTLVREGWAAPTSTGNDPTDERFPTEQAAMFVSGYWVWGWLQANYPEFVEKVGVAPIPAPDADSEMATVYGGWTVMVYADTEHPEAAAEFAINMFGAEDNARAAAWTMEYNTKLSPRQSVLQGNEEFYSQFPHDVFANEIFPIARAEPSFPPEIAQSVWDALQSVMFADVPAEDAVQIWAETIDSYLMTR